MVRPRRAGLARRDHRPLLRRRAEALSSPSLGRSLGRSLGLVLVAPAGGQDHTSPRVAAQVASLAERGWTPAVVRSLEAVPPLLAAHPGPVGLVGVGQGARLGLTLLTAEPRVRAAVLALPPELDDVSAPDVPVRFLPGGGLVDPDALAAATDWLLDRITPVVVLPGGPLLPPAYLGDLGGLGTERDLVVPDLPLDRCDRLVPRVEAIREVSAWPASPCSPTRRGRAWPCGTPSTIRTGSAAWCWSPRA